MKEYGDKGGGGSRGGVLLVCVSWNNGVDSGGSGGKVEPCGQLHTRFTMIGIIF